MTRITTVGVITLVAAVSAAAIYKAKVRNDHQVDSRTFTYHDGTDSQ